MNEQTQQMTVKNTCNGSPRNETCANTVSWRTATTTSLPGVISPAPGPGDRRQGLAPMTAAEHTTDPVPLYLVPQALSAEIHRLGGSILEVHIRRTGCHNYLIILTTGGR